GLRGDVLVVVSNSRKSLSGRSESTEAPKQPHAAAAPNGEQGKEWTIHPGRARRYSWAANQRPVFSWAKETRQGAYEPLSVLPWVYDAAASAAFDINACSSSCQL